MGRTRCERTALILLAMMCMTVIFSTAIVQILVVLLTLLAIRCVEAGAYYPFRRTPLDIPYLAFVIGRVASVVFSKDLAKSLPALSGEFIFYVVFFIVTQSIRENEFQAGRILTSILIWAGVIAGVIGTLKVVLSFDPRGSSTTAGTYTLGTYLCPVLALGLVAPFYGRGSRVARWFVPLAMCLGIVFTFDRLHWVTMGLTLGIAGIILRRRAVVFILGAVLLASLLSPTIRFRAVQFADLGSLTSGRDVLWKGASTLISVHPMIGFGPRTFSEIFPFFELLPFRGVGSWHNDYLQVYMESGLVGLLPLVWLIVATFVYARRLLRSATLSLEQRRLVLSLLIALSLIFLAGGVIDTHVGIVFRTLLGLLALLLTRTGESSTAQPDSLSGIEARVRQGGHLATQVSGSRR